MLRFFSVLCCCLSLLTGGAARAEWQRVEMSGAAADLSAEFWLSDAARADELGRSAQREFQRVIDLLDVGSTGSELAQLNAKAPVEPQAVSSELYALIDVGLQIAELTEGAFDITIESVAQLYDFENQRRPDELELEALLTNVDYRQVALDADARTVAFLRPAIRLSLGGLTHGYACEQVMRVLKDAGVKDARVTVGSATRLLGDRRGSDWLVAIANPADPAAAFTRLALRNEAVATVTDYTTGFEREGARYHPTLNPATGLPAQGARSATVVGPDATLADALASSLLVLGAEAGMAMLGGVPDYEALIIVDENTWYYSGGLAPE